MKCFWCGGPLDSHDQCPRCGQDVTMYKKILRISNSCYNHGLELAQVRDLSGAIFWLQHSLKWNKNNIAARNLLGLIYYEIGEVEDALEEWTISASFHRENNPASHYLGMIAARQARVDNISQVIRKYNLAIHYIREDSEDLAILQAKQIISRNSHHLKAHLLLALLYMKKGAYAKAERILRKALRIDAGNPTTLRYLSELSEIAKDKRIKSLKKRSEPTLSQQEDEENVQGADVLIPTYSEKTGSWRVVFLMILGVLIGVVTTYFLIFPAERRQLQQEANKVQQEYFASLNQLRNEIARLESGEIDWSAERESLLEQLAAYAEADTNQEQMQEKYDQLLLVYAYKATGDDYHAMEELQKLNPEGEVSEQFLASYQSLTAEYSTEGAMRLYNASAELCVQSQFEAARDNLLMVLQWNKDFPDAIYLLGTCYWNLADRETAATYFNQMITEYPEHPLTAEAKNLLATAG